MTVDTRTPDALPVERLNQLLNSSNAPTFEAIASTGQGVFPTLKALAELRGRRRVHFGIWCDVVAAGPVSRGDPVTVAATAS